MYNSFPQLVFGFYGCDRKVGEAVIAGDMQLVISKNSYDWLGSGIYFWENAPARALAWAVDCAKNPRKSKGAIKEPFVLGTVINLGHCLNLTDKANIDILQETYGSIRRNCEAAGIAIPRNSKGMKELDCLIINAALKSYQDSGEPGFDSVRGSYIEGTPIYEGSSLFDDTHIQICIRNPNCIKGYFRPLKPISGYPIP